MLGGVMFNFILAIIIYAGIAWHWGSAYIPLQEAYEGMDFVEEARTIGFRNGDIPLKADGKEIDSSTGDFAYVIASASKVDVLRDHRDTVSIAIPENFILKINERGGFMSFRVPAFVGRYSGLYRTCSGASRQSRPQGTDHADARRTDHDC